MASIKLTYVLHNGGGKIHATDVKPFDEQLCNKVKECYIRRHALHIDSNTFSINLLADYGEIMGYHNLCYSYFAALSTVS